jgi:carboxyl-terminal processing protease
VRSGEVCKVCNNGKGTFDAVTTILYTRPNPPESPDATQRGNMAEWTPNPRCLLATVTPPDVRKRMRIGSRVLLLLLTFFALPAVSSAQTIGADDLLKQAAEAEKQRDWREACRLYDEVLRRDRRRDDARIRKAYQRCLRRYYIVHRHQDRIYRQALERLEPRQALDTYAHVLETIERVYADRVKSKPAELFKHGLDELRLAFEEPSFVANYFADLSPSTLEAFKKKLAEFRHREIKDRHEARDQVRAVSRTAQQMGLGTQPLVQTAIILEFLSGACNALDEYTFFLTPSHYRAVQAVLRGQVISIGVDVGVNNKQQLQITRVYPRSPAAEAGLQAGDRLERIDGKSTDKMTADKALELLRGKSGSRVKLEILRYEEMGSFTLELTRRAVVVPSVASEMLPSQNVEIDGMKVPFSVGKLTISYFQESTLQEVKEALAAMEMAGMQALIIDVRRNPGGLFTSAVQVAELFLPEGLIVVSQTQVPLKDKDRRMSGPIRADNLNALVIPMVVLIDAETASAAEVLAGALKDNGRAKLMGQTTFGKGSIQCILPLDKPHFQRLPGGLRITVAKLLSPSWQPYSGRGISPNFPTSLDKETILDEARALLLAEWRSSLQPMTMAH